VELLAPNSADGSSVHALRATPDVAESSDGSEELVDELVEGQLVVVGWVVAVAFEETLGEGGAILKVSLVERRLRVMRARSWQGSARPMRPVSMRPTTSMLSGATEVRAQVRPIDVTEHFRSHASWYEQPSLFVQRAAEFPCNHGLSYHIFLKLPTFSHLQLQIIPPKDRMSTRVASQKSGILEKIIGTI